MYYFGGELFAQIRETARLEELHADRTVLQSYGMSAEEIRRYQAAVFRIEERYSALMARKAGRRHSAPPSQAPVDQPAANPAEGEHACVQANDYRDVRRGRTD